MIYIDLGAYNGDTVEKFLRSHPQITHVWAFEPHPYPKEWAEVMTKHPMVQINFIQKAAWIKTGKLDFAICTNPHSHTLMADCMNYEKGETTTVQAIDIIVWLRELRMRPDLHIDHVIVKIDVEGAEYDILEHLIANGDIKLIDELYVEFHDWIMPVEYAERHARILARSPIPIHGWE